MAELSFFFFFLFLYLCSRYFIGKAALTTHYASKLHKKRLKLLEEEPYTLAEAEAGAGMMKEKRKKTTGEMEVSTPSTSALPASE